jgi:hypothetical protein
VGAGVCFDSAPWRATGSSILRGVDNIQQLLDDQVVKTQAMRASPYIGPFEEQVKTWEAKLNQTQVREAFYYDSSVYMAWRCLTRQDQCITQRYIYDGGSDATGTGCTFAMWSNALCLSRHDVSRMILLAGHPG